MTAPNAFQIDLGIVLCSPYQNSLSLSLDSLDDHNNEGFVRFKAWPLIDDVQRLEHEHKKRVRYLSTNRIFAPEHLRLDCGTVSMFF